MHVSKLRKIGPELVVDILKLILGRCVGVRFSEVRGEQLFKLLAGQLGVHLGLPEQISLLLRVSIRAPRLQ